MDSIVRTQLDKHAVSAQTFFYRTIIGGECELTPNWLRGLSKIQMPSFNILMPFDESGLSDDLLADTAAFFYSHDVMYAIELVHDQCPAGPEYLNQRRYQPLPPQPAMYLSELPADVNLNEAVKVERVQTVPQHTAFYTLLHQVYDFSLSDMVKLYPVAHLKEENFSTVRHYLAFVDEEPVAATTLICQHGVTSVWNLCTVDSYRRKGVATAMLHQALGEAKRDGYNLAMIYATAQAFLMLNKFGFEMYTQRQWFLPPGLVYED